MCVACMYGCSVLCLSVCCVLYSIVRVVHGCVVVSLLCLHECVICDVCCVTFMVDTFTCLNVCIVFFVKREFLKCDYSV